MRPGLLFPLLSSAAGVLASPIQDSQSDPLENPKLHGRFLSISDIHLDPYYKKNTSISGACHAHHPSDKSDTAGYWGSPDTNCDTPPALAEAVFEELKQWQDKIDFVIWMGDNARHDIDSNIPRTLPEIFGLNQQISDRLSEIFPDIPLIPSIGNNDVYPHNVMSAGPSRILSTLNGVWKDYIPEEQFHTFARGGYYGAEVIPGKLLAVGLNTLLWFQSNSLVDGCPPDKGKGTRDPGTEQLLWLEEQLKIWRNQGLQVILSGHVPPASYYSQCYDRFAEISLAYQDTIIASIFGHANVDHFTIFTHVDSSRHRLNFDFTTQSAADLPNNLQDAYGRLPKHPSADDYVFNNICPSVIPTYQPSYRIWSYNTTGSSYRPHQSENIVVERADSMDDDDDEEDADEEIERSSSLHQQLVFQQPGESALILDDEQVDGDFEDSPIESFRKKHKKKKGKKRKKKKAKYNPIPRHVSPDSPSRTNRFLSLLGYVQYYLPLHKVNKHNGWGDESKNRSEGRPFPHFEIEYTTMPFERLSVWLQEMPDISAADLLLQDWQRGQEAAEENESITQWLKKERAELAPYELPDLTVSSWLNLAETLSKGGKVWKGYVRRMFVGVKDL